MALRRGTRHAPQPRPGKQATVGAARKIDTPLEVGGACLRRRHRSPRRHRSTRRRPSRNRSTRSLGRVNAGPSGSGSRHTRFHGAHQIPKSARCATSNAHKCTDTRLTASAQPLRKGRDTRQTAIRKVRDHDPAPVSPLLPHPAGVAPGQQAAHDRAIAEASERDLQAAALLDPHLLLADILLGGEGRCNHACAEPKRVLPRSSMCSR